MGCVASRQEVYDEIPESAEFFRRQQRSETLLASGGKGAENVLRMARMN